MRGRPLAVGSTVVFRLFNTPDKHFYGEFSRGMVVEIKNIPSWGEKMYRVMSDRFSFFTDHSMWLHRKEIRKVVK